MKRQMGKILFVSPRHHLNISRVTLSSQVGLRDVPAGSMATLAALVCQKALRIIIFRQVNKPESKKPYSVVGSEADKFIIFEEGLFTLRMITTLPVKSF